MDVVGVVDDDDDDVRGLCGQPPRIRDNTSADRVVGRSTNPAVVISDMM
jgi:hypothetical protein